MSVTEWSEFDKFDGPLPIDYHQLIITLYIKIQNIIKGSHMLQILHTFYINRRI